MSRPVSNDAPKMSAFSFASSPLPVAAIQPLGLPGVGAVKSAFDGIIHRTEKTVLTMAAHLPGDPLTKSLRTALPGSTVERTSASSWKITDSAGAKYEAWISGNRLYMVGPEGSHSERILKLPSLPSLPKLPKLQVGKLASTISNGIIGASMNMGGRIAPDVIASAVQKKYPGAQVRSDGHATWTVSNLEGQEPFQVQIHGNTIRATRDGEVLASRTITAGDFKTAFKELFARA